MSDATVYKHIQKPIDAGIVKEVALKYDTIADKPEKMVKYENAPRPDNI